MSIELVESCSPIVDEAFVSASKSALVTNTDYDFTGAHTVKVYTVSTAQMQDYQRNFYADSNETARISRYGDLVDLNATTQEMTLSKDRSFIFNIDTLDMNETQAVLEAQVCLLRQLRDVIIPEVDKYVYKKMADGAGFNPDAVVKNGFKYYDSIIEANMEMDEAEVPDTNRVLILSAAGYAALKKELNQVAYNDVDAEERAKGVISHLDGLTVIKVPSTYLPDNFAFMIAHPSACCLAQKLADFGIHRDTPLSSGSIVTGRICYDAFVLNNKKKGIYLQTFTAPAVPAA